MPVRNDQILSITSLADQAIYVNSCNCGKVIMVGLATVSSLAQAIKTLFLRAAKAGFQIDGFSEYFSLGTHLAANAQQNRQFLDYSDRF